MSVGGGSGALDHFCRIQKGGFGCTLHKFFVSCFFAVIGKGVVGSGSTSENYNSSYHDEECHGVVPLYLEVANEHAPAPERPDDGPKFVEVFSALYWGAPVVFGGQRVLEGVR